jgi:hypothetical protein
MNGDFCTFRIVAATDDLRLINEAYLVTKTGPLNEQLRVAQLFYRFSATEPDVLSPFFHSPPLTPVFKQFNPHLIIRKYFSKINFNIVLSSSSVSTVRFSCNTVTKQQSIFTASLLLMSPYKILVEHGRKRINIIVFGTPDIGHISCN